ncbi:hypothetical protein CLPUN_21300 [Clostridium puniceum]|uniref:Uncharacterized protein n=1 Tax=Clostridium puniceum TaxID=29367 RepID=A0A1S8TJJ1_9CLOT|nr:hypothetical protein [Clostridium puniceum]OOM77957.1 hypothetical protein CLPUN_21300 [Clostridium puniceum]
MVKFQRFINATVVEIIAYVDNDTKKQGTSINNINIISPSHINKSIYDYIIIASEYYDEIRLQLKELEITKDILSIFGDYSLNEYICLFDKILTDEGKETVKFNYECYRDINYSLINIKDEYSIGKCNNMVNKYYKEKENYKIEYNCDEVCDNELCVIYFSSNGIYYPSTIDEFKKSIIIGDNYEWFKTRINKAKKHIFCVIYFNVGTQLELIMNIIMLI